MTKKNSKLTFGVILPAFDEGGCLLKGVTYEFGAFLDLVNDLEVLEVTELFFVLDRDCLVLARTPE